MSPAFNQYGCTLIGKMGFLKNDVKYVVECKNVKIDVILYFSLIILATVILVSC